MNLKQYLQHHCGTLTNCAEIMQVSRQTLNTYINSDPEAVLRYTSYLMKIDTISPRELIEAVYVSVKQQKVHEA